MALESFAVIAAGLHGHGYDATRPAPPARRGRHGRGTPNARRSDIRRPHAEDCPEHELPSCVVGPRCTCGKKMRRRRSRQERINRRFWRYTHRRHWIMRAIVGQLLEVDTDDDRITFSPPEIAAALPCDKRTVQTALTELQHRHVIERTDKAGGRGRRLEIRINWSALIAFSGRLCRSHGVDSWQLALQNGTERSAQRIANRRINSEDDYATTSLVTDRKGDLPLIPLEGKFASGAPAATGKPRRDEGPKRGPPSTAEIHALKQRADRATTSEKRLNGLKACIRLAAWRRGMKYRVSAAYVQNLASVVRRMGKRSNAETLAREVLARLIADREPIPTTWPRIRHWQFEAAAWMADWLERRRAARRT